MSGPLVIRHTDKAARSCAQPHFRGHGGSSYSEEPTMAQRAHRDHGSETDHDTVHKPSIAAERENTTVCSRDVVERHGHCRHNQRYSNLIAYIDGRNNRAG